MNTYKAWEVCSECGAKLRYHEAGFETMCNKCKSALKRVGRLRKISELTIEERLYKIESWILAHEDQHPGKEIW